MNRKPEPLEGLLVAFLAYFAIEYAINPIKTTSALFAGLIALFVLLAYVRIPDLKTQKIQSLAFAIVFGLPFLSFANFFIRPVFDFKSSGEYNDKPSLLAISVYAIGFGIGLLLCLLRESSSTTDSQNATQDEEE